MAKPHFIPLFKVLSTHGLKGDLKVALLTNNPELISYIKDLYIKNNWENPFKIKYIKKGPGFNIYILSFEETNYDLASSLVNQFLYLNLSDLPPTKEEEFYYYQLENLTVIDTQGKEWGTVVSVMPVGEYELLLIRTEDKREFYLPLVEEYVEKVDLEKRLLLVKNIDDLVESQR